MFGLFRNDPKNQTLDGKNWTLGGMGGQKLSKIVGHHLWIIPYVYVRDYFWDHFSPHPPLKSDTINGCSFLKHVMCIENKQKLTFLTPPPYKCLRNI